MSVAFNATKTSTWDEPLIHQLFEHSITYQEKHGYPSWRNYDRQVVRSDIESGNQYKITVEDEIAIVFSVLYADKFIWREMDKGDSIYLHRIVINPAFKGQRLFGKILQWAKEHINAKGLKYIRMDTWAANPAIIEYYKTFGFHVVETYTTPNAPELPTHNRNISLTLLEYRELL